SFSTTDKPTTKIYTLSLHDALPICHRGTGRKKKEMPRSLESSAKRPRISVDVLPQLRRRLRLAAAKRDLTVQQYILETIEARLQDRKSTRLNSSHVSISYAVFCLKK